MPFDGLFCSAVARELRAAIGSKIDKIYEPTPNEVLLVLRSSGDSARLLLSIDPGAGRVQLTEARPDNPPQAPAFCMLLRKKLLGARFSALEQQQNDRVLSLFFETFNELGDPVTRELRLELLGRTANLLLTEGSRILDALRRVDLSQSPERPILPGGAYQPPPAQDKVLLEQADPSEILKNPEVPLQKALLGAISGLSPLVARELAFRLTGQVDSPCSAVTPEALRKELAGLCRERENPSCFTALIRPEKGWIDFSFVDIRQYGEGTEKRTYPTAGALLDDFYARREREALVSARGQDLKRVVKTHTARLSRKIEIQKAEWEKAGENEKKGAWGDLILANLYRIPPGARSVTGIDYTDPGQRELTVPLDETLTPSQQAQVYYKQFRKAKTAREHIREELARADSELRYLESVREALSRASSTPELAEIRQELTEGGYLRAPRGKQPRPAPLPPLRYEMDGIELLVGRNNLQNDRLTHRVAQKNEWWLHVKDAPGAHVIVRAESPPEEVLLFAARLAALHSGAQGKTAVDATRARFVKKRPGAAPGMVTYTNQNTLFVEADAQEAEKRRK